MKQEVLQAWLIAGRKEEVYQAALNAKSEEEASEAIRMLGVMGAVDELRKLGDRPNAVERACGCVCDQRRSREPAQDRRGQRRTFAPYRSGSQDRHHRRAMRRARALREIYTRSSDAEIKDAALQGMLIAGDEQGVLTLYRAAKTDR